MNYNEMMAERQKEEIASVAPRTITLNLSDADVFRIAMRAAEGGMTVPELLESFIGDLVRGTYSNGYRASDCAWQWYEQCGFAMIAATDIALFAQADELENLIDCCETYADAQEVLAVVKADFLECEDVTEDDVKRAERWLEESIADIKEIMERVKCTSAFEKVVQDALSWKADFEAFRGQNKSEG